MSGSNRHRISSYTIDVEGIGIISLERSSRARRLVISIRPLKGVSVAVPNFVSFRKAEAFVLSNTGWITKHLEKMKQRGKQIESIQDGLDDINMAAATKTLTDRFEQLADKHGFRYNKLSIRRQRTRWGSCSPKNNISLNARLVKLPDELMDYVILHELVHTRIHNHSLKFWAELDRYVENSKGLAKKLRADGLELT